MGAALLVTGSSDRAVDDALIAAAETAAGGPFKTLLVAAHSGGYVGLNATLASTAFTQARLKRAVLLDDFYDGGAGIPALRALVRRGGFGCSGFYTWQSDPYAATAKTYGDVCHVEPRSDYGNDSHGRVVNLCLASYLAGRRCLPIGTVPLNP